MRKKILRNKWTCTSKGSVNNGALSECNFEFTFDSGFTPHCPTCGSKMAYVPDGPSVSELLRRGFLENNK